MGPLLSPSLPCAGGSLLFLISLISLGPLLPPPLQTHWRAALSRSSSSRALDLNPSTHTQESCLR